MAKLTKREQVKQSIRHAIYAGDYTAASATYAASPRGMTPREFNNLVGATEATARMGGRCSCPRCVTVTSPA